MNEKFSNTCKVYKCYIFYSLISITFILILYPYNMQRKFKGKFKGKRKNSFFLVSCFIVDDLFSWIKMSFHFSQYNRQF